MSAAYTIQLTPFTFTLDDCTVTVLEVLKSTVIDTTFYHVVCKIKCSDIETRQFTLDVRSTKELRAKLLAEIAKLKALVILYGADYARRVVA